MVAALSTPAARSPAHSPSRGGLLTQLSPSELSNAVRKFSWLAADVVAHGVGLSQASCNQPAYFFLEAPTFARGLQFRAQLRGPSVLAATIRDRGDGSYEAKYTCAVSGDYALHVTLGPPHGRHEHVSGSPASIVVSAAEACAEQSVVGGACMSRGHARAGEEIVLVITPRDAFGNLARRGGGGAPLPPFELLATCSVPAPRRLLSPPRAPSLPRAASAGPADASVSASIADVVSPADRPIP